MDAAHADLPAADSIADGRTVLHATLDTPVARLSFSTTQLSSIPARSSLRCAQVRCLARSVATHAESASLPPIVTGDFNALPESDEVRLVEGVLTEPAVTGLGFVDAWRYAAPHARGITWSRDNPHAAVTGEPDSRIDYIFVGLPRPRGGAVVTGVRLVGDRPYDGVWPSDHAGVAADLRLGEPPDLGPGAQ